MKEILNRIDRFLKQDDIIKSSDIISLYDLYKILEYQFDDLKNLKIQTKDLQDKINSESLYNTGPLKSMFPYNRCCFICPFPKTQNELDMLLIRTEKQYGNYHDFHIFRDEQGLKCNNNRKHRIVKRYSDEINAIFDVLEDYDLFKGDRTQELRYDCLNIKISYQIDGIILLNIKPNKQNNIDILNWSNLEPFMLEPILSFYTLNLSFSEEELLLRKIPVKISELNENLRPMVKEYLSMNNAPVIVKKKKLEIPPNIDLSSLG